MAIISESDEKSRQQYGSSQFRYALIYVIVTSIVLVFLNIYSFSTNQQLIYQSKESSMIEKCQLAATEISNLEVLNPSSASSAVSQMGSLRVARLIITGQAGTVMYDSLGEAQPGSFVLLPEVVQALQGNDVFSWRYHDGTMYSHAATPVYAGGKLTACVYMMEYDVEQGAIIKSLQKNILTITLVLELAVIIFSVIFTTGYSARLRRILTSMRSIRSGD